jgi:hypothetical protein
MAIVFDDENLAKGGVMTRMRRNRFHRWGLVAALLSLAALAGCERTKISDILAHPNRFSGYPVTIAGRVISTYGEEPTKGKYELDDGSGQLWVLSVKVELPQKGSLVAVTGFVDPEINLGTTTLPTVLQESSRTFGGD